MKRAASLLLLLLCLLYATSAAAAADASVTVNWSGSGIIQIDGTEYGSGAVVSLETGTHTLSLTAGEGYVISFVQFDGGNQESVGGIKSISIPFNINGTESRQIAVSFMNEAGYNLLHKNDNTPQPSEAPVVSEQPSIVPSSEPSIAPSVTPASPPTTPQPSSAPSSVPPPTTSPSPITAPSATPEEPTADASEMPDESAEPSPSSEPQQWTPSANPGFDEPIKNGGVGNLVEDNLPEKDNQALVITGAIAAGIAAAVAGIIYIIHRFGGK